MAQLRIPVIWEKKSAEWEKESADYVIEVDGVAKAGDWVVSLNLEIRDGARAHAEDQLEDMLKDPTEIVFG